MKVAMIILPVSELSEQEFKYSKDKAVKYLNEHGYEVFTDFVAESKSADPLNRLEHNLHLMRQSSLIYFPYPEDYSQETHYLHLAASHFAKAQILCDY